MSIFEIVIAGKIFKMHHIYNVGVKRQLYIVHEVTESTCVEANNDMAS